MVKKSERLGLILLLCLSLTNFSGNQAFADNTLNQIDVRKNSSDGLEFTLYTSSPYAENVVVTQKSDNKYVILMPNVNNAPNAKPDFSPAKDIITDVDVRAVNDGQGGYTKVTVITNRPVDIKTNTAKAAPVTQEQREYRALIAQQKTKPIAAPPSIPAKTEQKAEQKAETKSFKLPEIQPTHTAADIVSAQNVVEKIASTKNNITKQITKTEPKPAINKKETAVEKKTLKELNNIVPTSLKKSEQPKVEKHVKNETKAVEKVAQNEVKKEVSTKEQNKIIKEEGTINKENTQPTTVANEQKTKAPIDILGRMPKNMPVTIAIILVPLIFILGLFNLIRNSLRNSQLLKKSFMDNISKRNQTAPVQNYDNIINNENLNWQEKYQQYVDVTGDKPQDLPKAPKYNFVTQAKQTENVKVEFIDDSTVEENQNEKLERILQASPDIEKTVIEDDIQEMENILSTSNNIADETKHIHKEIKKSTRFKAFEEKIALEETHRNKKIKHRRVHLEIPKEMQHINLGYSQLHTNPRSFKNATLSVSDLIAKSNKLLNLQPENKEEKNDYEMISIDEYFNIMNDDKSNVTSSLSSTVADSLGKIKEKSIPMPKPTIKTTNPIANTKKETKSDYLSGLIVKSGFDIDKERGFYLVSLDGKSAVIGRIKDEVFVLKKFDRNITKPLQVRRDNPNVYMVKAEEFKSLVEVNNDKMGVLIEL